MVLSKLSKRYDARIATMNSPLETWVRSFARNIDLTNKEELKTAVDLMNIMSEFVEEYGWIGASSNNIYWNGSEKPLKMIQVPNPDKDELITILNPHNIIVDKLYS